jgi:hypothetical protein
MDKFDFEKHFWDIETETQYCGHLCGVADAIVMSALGSFCGLCNMKQIIQWANVERVRAFLRKEFAIYDVPCYSWFTQILGDIKPRSFNERFTKWIISLAGIMRERRCRSTARPCARLLREELR